MSQDRGKHFVGTSGWSYDHWEGPFYPAGLGSDERLEYYAARFGCVEINNAFYQLPSEKSLQTWRETVPGSFKFAVKASRYITHMKKLNDPQDSLDHFFSRISLLGDQLGPLLFQLPPKWGFDPERLSAFLQLLDKRHKVAFEFRDHSWLNDEAFELLAQHGAALCIYDLDGFTSPKTLTTNFAYVRLHGPDGPYRGSYDNQTLAGWAGAISAWSRKGLDCYCFFDNDEDGHAVRNASRLRDMLGD